VLVTSSVDMGTRRHGWREKQEDHRTAYQVPVPFLVCRYYCTRSTVVVSNAQDSKPSQCTCTNINEYDIPYSVSIKITKQQGHQKRRRSWRGINCNRLTFESWASIVNTRNWSRDGFDCHGPLSAVHEVRD